jgi:hypothetical protein
MKDNSGRRALVLRFALALLACGAALAFSPNLVQQSFASDGDVTCTATCSGGSCTGNKTYCVCTCSWFFGLPVCNCTNAPPEQTQTPEGSSTT